MKAFKNISAKLLPTVISFLLSSTAIVYDKNFNVVEYWVEKDQNRNGMIELYNKDWTRKGYIKKEGDQYTIYDKNWERQGYIKGIEDYKLEKRR